MRKLPHPTIYFIRSFAYTSTQEYLKDKQHSLPFQHHFLLRLIAQSRTQKEKKKELKNRELKFSFTPTHPRIFSFFFISQTPHFTLADCVLPYKLGEYRLCSLHFFSRYISIEKFLLASRGREFPKEINAEQNEAKKYGMS